MQLATRHGVAIPDSQATNIGTTYNDHYDQLGNLVHDAAAHIDGIDGTAAGKVKRVDQVRGAGEAARTRGLGRINEGTVPQAREGSPPPLGPMHAELPRQ